MSGHSRRCAESSMRAGSLLGFDDDTRSLLRRAALVHDLGTTAVPNSIWDKPGQLTSAESDRVRLHSLLTEQMLRRSPALAALNPIAAAHHERANGSGYHKGLRIGAGELASSVLAATDIYVGLTTDRADRAAFGADDAAAELRRLEANGELDAKATDAVLAAACHANGWRTPRRRADLPAALTMREVEVLRLAALGLTTRDIADRLYISPKTADHHIQHVYTKIGVSSRASAALWAMQHDVLD